MLEGGSANRAEQTFGQTAERVTFRSDAAQLEMTVHTSTPLKRVDASYGKWKNMGDEALLESGRPSKTVAFEIGDGSEEESTAMPRGSRSFSGLLSYFGSADPEKTLTEVGLYEREAMARAKTDGMGPDLNVGTSSGFVRVPTVGSSSVPTAVETTRTKYYPSQSAKSLLKDFFELNPPTHVDPAPQTTSFTADQMIQFAKAVDLEVLLASFGMLEELLKAKLNGGRSCGVVEKVSGRSSFPGRAGTTVSESMASRSVFRYLQLLTRLKVGQWLRLGRTNRVRAVKLMKFCRLSDSMWSEWD